MEIRHYIQLKLRDPSSDLLVTEADILRQAIRLTQKQFPFETLAAVVLPERFLTIWTLPDGDEDCESRWRLIQSIFARHTAGSAAIWHPDAEHRVISNPVAFEKYWHLTATAPVRAGLASLPRNWPLSSFATQGPPELRASEPLPRLHEAKFHQLL